MFRFIVGVVAGVYLLNYLRKLKGRVTVSTKRKIDEIENSLQWPGE